MNRIRMYRAGLPNGFPGDTFEFSTLAELTSIPAVQEAMRPGFKRWSVCRDLPLTLMIDVIGGWAVVGFLKDDLPALPTWQYRKLSYAA